jgi:isopenicillin N synthase-like dioxygenase
MSLEGAAVKAASTLPIIDIAPWIEGHDHKGRLSTAAAIHAACLEYGFFYLDITSYLDPSEPQELSRLAHQFFDLPQEEKEIISLNNQDYARGAPPFYTLLMTGPHPSERIPKAEGKCY